MANKILILGQSGTGKSRSIKGLDPKETKIIQSVSKQIPFKGGKVYSKDNQNLTVKDDYPNIYTFLKVWNKDNEVKNIIIDDSQYLIINEFMRSSTDDLRGAAVFDKYNVLARNFWNLLMFVDSLRSDLNVFFLHHLEVTDKGEKVKTCGNMLDRLVCIEGHFTYVLVTEVEENKYFFRTNGSGLSKTPEEMFPETIENDLQIVLDGIKNY